jgi:serine phosphatase RsbU (regulator of sigma subunit)
LRAHRDDPAEQIIEAICASAREFANQEHFADDVTILVIKVL